MANYEIVALVEGTPQLRAPTAADTGVVTNLAVTTNLTATAGTANGVVYLNGSKVQTSGAGLTCDGENIVTLRGTGNYAGIIVDNNSGTGGGYVDFRQNNSRAGLIGCSGAILGDTSKDLAIFADSAGGGIRFYVNASSSEAMRLTSTGLAVTGAISATTTIRPGGYTVATLPAGTIGMKAYVTDALAPAFLTLLVGGGAAYSGAQFNGTIWVGD